MCLMADVAVLQACSSEIQLQFVITSALIQMECCHGVLSMLASNTTIHNKLSKPVINSSMQMSNEVFCQALPDRHIVPFQHQAIK